MSFGTAFVCFKIHHLFSGTNEQSGPYRSSWPSRLVSHSCAMSPEPLWVSFPVCGRNHRSWKLDTTSHLGTRKMTMIAGPGFRNEEKTSCATDYMSTVTTHAQKPNCHNINQTETGSLIRFYFRCPVPAHCAQSRGVPQK